MFIFHEGFGEYKDTEFKSNEYYLNTDIVQHAMNGFISLIEKSANHPQCINFITKFHLNQCHKVQNKYIAKKAQIRLLFDGFIRINMNNLFNEIFMVNVQIL